MTVVSRPDVCTLSHLPPLPLSPPSHTLQHARWCTSGLATAGVCSRRRASLETDCTRPSTGSPRSAGSRPDAPTGPSEETSRRKYCIYNLYPCILKRHRIIV